MVRHDDKNEDKKNQRIIILLGILLIIIALAAIYFIYTLVINPEKEMAANNTAISQTKELNGQSATKHKKKKRKKKKVQPANEAVTPGSTATSANTEEKGKKGSEKSEEKNKTKPANETTDKKEINKKPANEETKESKAEENITSEAKEPKKTNELSETPGTVLNVMPDRKTSKGSPFALSDQNIITVKESSFEEIKIKASKDIGRQNPFAKGDVKPTVNELLKTINNLKNKLSGQKPTSPNITSMPEVPQTGSNIIPPVNKTEKNKIPQPPDMANASPADDVASRTNLTGIIGSTAIIDLDGKTKALHAGQNFEGIVVLSVSPRSAVLKINGVKVVKQLKD